MKTILLADDEPNIRLLVRTTLEGPDYRILEAADGSTALKMAQKESPDLIILDWLMPGLTGIEVASRLHENEHTARLPIIMLTCKGQPGDMAQGRAAGVDTYLIKPFSPMEVLDRVQDALGQDAISQSPNEQ
ncbi:MAG: response regulator [Phycisphaeraceae bacterium]|nr:response regulator [Phycisphaeraceae bacterium]